MTIHSGDLIHADKHGVCLIPHEISDRLAEACRTVEAAERPLLDICRGDQFTLEGYLKLRKEFQPKIRE